MYKGKAIYNPSGKAGEYSYWACNFYVGCSNDCSYCYCKKGVLAHAMGSTTPTLKKCFKDVEHAFAVFKKELEAVKYIPELRENGLFFSFTTDPMLPDTVKLTQMAIGFCIQNCIPVKVLTKRADWIQEYPFFPMFFKRTRRKIAFGFTLTGRDELEPGASTNQERIEAMKKLHDAGFKTFASIEPIVVMLDSLHMIRQTAGFCDLYKIGLMSGMKIGEKERMLLVAMMEAVGKLANENGFSVYYKDSFLKAVSIERSELPIFCVSRDYNIFQPETTNP